MQVRSIFLVLRFLFVFGRGSLEIWMSFYHSEVNFILGLWFFFFLEETLML